MIAGKVLVTGGAGFIGTHLIHRLIAQGAQVAILDDLSTGSRENLHPDARFLEGSVTDPDAVARAIEGCDAVVHLAAMVSVPDCVADWKGGHGVNIGGTINVFEAAARAGNLPVVYASSAAVYGDQGDLTCHEGLLPAPLSPYGADKLACEHHARAFWNIHGLPSAGLRFFNVYGPGQSISSPYAGVVARFCQNARQGIGHTVFGDGLQSRDFIHVSDVVEMILRALGLLQDAPASLVSNICTDSSTSLLDLIAALDEVFPGSGAEVAFKPARAGDIRFSRGDDARMREIFGPLRRRTLVEGLAELAR